MPKGRRLIDSDIAIETIIAYLSAGHFVDTAAKAAGVDPETVSRYIKAYETGEGDEASRELGRMFAEAIAKAEVSILGKWMQAFDKDWRAVAAFLAKRFPDRYSAALKELSNADFNIRFEVVDYNPAEHGKKGGRPRKKREA
jgi:transposase